MILRLVLKDCINQIKNTKSKFLAFLLQRANVIFATLVSAGKKDMRININNVDMLIVDEAAQATVPQVLIPMHYCPKQCLHVGDIRQLPPYVSRQVWGSGFEHSLMDIMSMHDQEYPMFSTQYRMSEEINRWPSERYYQGELSVSISVKQSKELYPNIFALSASLKSSLYSFHAIDSGVYQVSFSPL